MKKEGRTTRPFQYDLNQIPNDYLGFPDSSVGKESTFNAGDPGWIPRLGRSAGEGIGYPLQYCPLSRWCHPIISSSVVAFSSCLQSFPASGSSQMSQFFTSDGKLLEFQLQHQSFQWTPRTDLLQNGLVGSPCSPRDSHESSPTPQFKSINSSALSFLYSPTLTSIHDRWKNHSLD